MPRVSKTGLWIVAGMLGIAGALGIGVYILKRDEPEPDLSRIRVEYRAIPAEKNGFVTLALAEDPLFWPLSAPDTLEAAESIYGKDGLPVPVEEDDPGSTDANLEEAMEKGLAWAGQEFDSKIAERTVSLNRAFLERLDRALRAPDFQVPEAISIANDPFTNTCGMIIREVGELQGCRMRLHLDRGEIDEAFDVARETVELARKVQHADIVLCSFLIATKLEESGLRQLRFALERAGPTKDSLKAFLAGIADDDGSTTRDFQRCLRVDGKILCHEIDVNVAQGNVDGDPSWWLALFVLPNQTKRLLAEGLASIFEISELPPMAREDGVREFDAWIGTLNDGRLANRVGRATVAFLLPTLRHSVDSVDLLLVSRRATRIAAAIRVHIEREGRTPRALADFRTSGLTEVPLDPFSGEAFHYDAERGILFSVGSDFVAQGGSEKIDQVWNDIAEPTFSMPKAGKGEGASGAHLPAATPPPPR